MGRCPVLADRCAALRDTGLFHKINSFMSNPTLALKCELHQLALETVNP